MQQPFLLTVYARCQSERIRKISAFSINQKGGQAQFVRWPCACNVYCGATIYSMMVSGCRIERGGSMADIQPIWGIRYAPDLRSQLASLLTPPYDVISPEAQASYYARHPYNIIRLELGRDEPGDDTLNNRYTRAAAALADWRREGIMVQEARPAFYLYRQRFRIGSTDYWRTSLLARVRLEPWEAGVVLPHEYTMPKPKGDRLKLMRACAANTSPIM